MIDGARAQLLREWDRAALRELVAVQAQLEPRLAASTEKPLGLGGVEGTPLEEDVRGPRESRGFGQHLGEREVEIRVGVRELRWHRMRAEPGRDPTRRGDRSERRELGVAVEAVPGLPLPGRRAVTQEPV